MDERDFCDALTEILESGNEDNEFEFAAGGIASVVSFDRAGLLTSNEGIVVRLADGSEFQVTVVMRSGASEVDGDEQAHQPEREDGA